MATCRNHAGREAPSVCSGCGASFCEACVVLCESCKATYLVGVDERPHARPGARGPVRRERPAPKPGNRTLDWALGAAALLFSGIFVVVIIAALATPMKALLDDRKLATAFDRLVQIGAAIERYRAATGSYPETLDALVPTYLSEVPQDPYSRKPPRYETAPSHRVWSVGPDAEDDGGEEPGDLVYAVEPIGGG
jgi:hypothetical protein